ncbi:MAG: hypothetical protein HPPSJP_2530 [Candidatus Hepatoplasma scabrum]|nr:MAG: hypothetical protein HPPSJP_2530 [Candidatus Hepatoplasma sp.]
MMEKSRKWNKEFKSNIFRILFSIIMLTLSISIIIYMNDIKDSYYYEDGLTAFQKGVLGATWLTMFTSWVFLFWNINLLTKNLNHYSKDINSIEDTKKINEDKENQDDNKKELF